jgi:hypothetical protein
MKTTKSKRNKTIMKKNYPKNQIITLGTTNKPTETAKKPKFPKSPRTLKSKKSTCEYYDCLKELVTLPENDQVKITDLTHKCKCSKEEILKQKAQIKHQLIHELARDYKNIGINLGKYVKADIVGCVKELEKTK